MGKAIVLGGYGLIGSACMRALKQAGFQVIGLGRSKTAAHAMDIEADWIIRDIPSVTTAEWREILSDVDVVVNASGALQDGARDNLEAIHVSALSNIVEACADLTVRFVQISAAGVSLTASTEFFRSKARGDAILSSGVKDWVILRPTLVLSPDAYGGTALLRAVAALPWLQPVVLPKAQVQTVHIEDVADAVVAAAVRKVPSGTIADLTESAAQSFPDLVTAFRQWQGWPPPTYSPPVPNLLLRMGGRVADALGLFGWRSPLRTTALTALRDGITGDPDTWAEVGDRPCRSLKQTLAQLPATRQERLFARAYFALPLAIATLSLFWCLSGFIALLDIPRAMSVLTGGPVPTWIVGFMVVGGAIADLFLGIAILWRAWSKLAALGMIALSAAYLLGGILFAPDLWMDPLGPMVKVFPGMTLAGMVWLLMEER